ncbi:MAG: carboxypeptidase-like regulatory domain-containing protein [Candidatus Omnitrophota bacterium]
MKRKRFLLFIAVLLTFQMISLASTLNGVVMDTNHQPIDHVTITILSRGESVTYSDANGKFSINFREGTEKATLLFEKDGFSPENKDLDLNQLPEKLEIILTPIK